MGEEGARVDAHALTLQVATQEHETALQNLFQLYTHDFSEQWAGQQRGELGEDGRFPPYGWLSSYWVEEGRIALLLRVEGHLAGFALLNRHFHAKPGADRNMAEFFVVRKHRRGGVGRAAVDAIFRRYPGLWETAVARRNIGALAFWRGVIGGHALVSDLEEIDVRTSDWDGPVLRYRVAGVQP
jgi:predicted acetyltransferase